MKAKYIEKRSKYLIARNVGVLICFWISFYKYILIAYKKDIHSSSFFKRNVARRTEHCFVSTHPPPTPPIGIPFVLHPRDTWPRGGKYFRGGEKWRPENGATFCDDDYDPGITTHFPLMFHKLFLNISSLTTSITILCNAPFNTNYLCFHLVPCSPIPRVKRLFFRRLFRKDKSPCYHVPCRLPSSGGLCFSLAPWS